MKRQRASETACQTRVRVQLVALTTLFLAAQAAGCGALLGFDQTYEDAPVGTDASPSPEAGSPGADAGAGNGGADSSAGNPRADSGGADVGSDLAAGDAEAEDAGVETGAADAGADAEAADSGVDSGVDAGVDAGEGGACSAPLGACAESVPAGWSLALFETGRTAACPGQFTSHDVVTAPVAGTGACGCSCAIDGSPSCTAGAMATYYGTNSSCSDTGVTINVPGPDCVTFSGNLGTYFAGTAPAATVSCSGSVTSDPTQVTTTQARYCDVPAGCQEEVCDGTVPANFSACIYTSGDASCPSGWSTATTVGESATLSCSACSCSASANCTSGSLAFFSDAHCDTSLVSVPVNGTCVATGGGAIGSYTYSATATNAQCAATGSKTATAGLTGELTVCCK